MVAEAPSTNQAPADYEELFRQFFDHTKKVVASKGIAIEDIEDAAANLFVTFMDKDALTWYDPSKFGGKTPPFKSLFNRFITTYVLQLRDKQETRHKREPIRLETPAGDKSIWVDVHAPVETDEALIASIESSIDLQETIRAAIERLRKVPQKSYKRDLVHLFKVMVRRAMDGDEVTGSVLAREVGLSDTIVYEMCRTIRSELRDLGFDGWLKEAIPA